MTDYNQAFAYVAAIADDPATAVIDLRAIHDTNKTVPALVNRSTLADAWGWITTLNAQGYGIFAVVAALDGQGRELANVAWLRANYVDLDAGDAQQQYEQACKAWPSPTFAVNSSPGKFHVYWCTQPYVGNERFELLQRKLRQTFNGDRSIIDATRVMRLPGTYHLKDPSAPHLVTCHALAGYGQPTTVETLESALASVNVIDGGVGTRHELGDPELAAPDVTWLERALELSDPNALDRYEWIALTAAWKQAGWSLLDPDTLYQRWLRWCSQYSADDPGENKKQWDSVRNSELGWPSLLARVPSLRASLLLGGQVHSVPTVAAVTPGAALAVPSDAPPMPEAQPLDCSGEFLTHLEQQTWFKGCIFVVNLGAMLAPNGRFLNANQFNAAYGGKRFIIASTGKDTNEPWAAATRSTLWQVPKVDHIRFVPDQPHHAIITDELGRAGVNVYKPIATPMMVGDATPFLNHVAALLPDVVDQRILFEYMAHNIKYPGHKIPWAPVIQSAEGAGKGVIKKIMRHAMGKPYVYYPSAPELAKSGAQFNAWLRNRLFILVDEIKVDERRELIEVLKPLISEEEAEVQPKGVDQELHDNFSNWLFFTNWKDAVPVSRNSRRFAIFYSPLQTVADLLARGMNDAYFNTLYAWLAADGAAIVTDWLMRYPIERGAIPMRAPATTSSAAAQDMSRGPIERVVAEAVEDGLPGFRSGWVSATAVMNRVKALGAVRGGSVAPHTVGAALEAMGYVSCGRAPRPYFQEDRETRSHLYHYGAVGDVGAYGRLQGWE